MLVGCCTTGRQVLVWISQCTAVKCQICGAEAMLQCTNHSGTLGCVATAQPHHQIVLYVVSCSVVPVGPGCPHWAAPACFGQPLWLVQGRCPWGGRFRLWFKVYLEVWTQMPTFVAERHRECTRVLFQLAACRSKLCVLRHCTAALPLPAG